VTRTLYIGAVALFIIFAALLSTSLPGRDLIAAGIYSFVNFKVICLCALIAVARIWSDSGRELRPGDVIYGGVFAVLAAATGGLWPWAFLIAFAVVFLLRTSLRTTRQALYLILAIGVHEIVVTLFGEMFAEIFLSVDALIAGSMAQWLLPDVLVSGAKLAVPGGHSLMLVWGCSSLSYVGDMMLLCWALSLLMTGKDGPGQGLWARLSLLAVITVTLNALRLAIMASGPEAYGFLHDGLGASAFRITLLSSAVCVAWLQSYYAFPKSLRIA